MGKVSLTGKVQEQIVTEQQDKSKLLPQLTKKEWTAVLTAVFIILLVGFSLGYVVNIKRLNDVSNIISTVDPLIQLENDLNDKLTFASKQMDKIEDEIYNFNSLPSEIFTG